MGGIVNKITEVSTLGLVKDVTGAEAGADAAKKAAGIQAASGQAAIDEQRAARLAFEERLSPFEQGGREGLQPLIDAITGGAEGANEQSSRIINNPFFQALAKDQEGRLMSSQAARGKLGSGETNDMLQQNILSLGNTFQRQEEQDRLNKIQNLFGLTQLGQTSAAGVGSAGLQTAQNVGNLLTDIGNVRASGVVGAQNARDAATDRVIGVGGALMGGFI